MRFTIVAMSILNVHTQCLMKTVGQCSTTYPPIGSTVAAFRSFVAFLSPQSRDFSCLYGRRIFTALGHACMREMASMEDETRIFEHLRFKLNDASP